MKWLIFHMYLKPMIIENYYLRSEGVLPDEWFWADRLATEWGYFINSPNVHQQTDKDLEDGK